MPDQAKVSLQQIMSHPFFWPRVVFVLLFLLVTFLTLTPNPDDVKTGFAMTRWLSELVLGDPERADKIAHFAAYGSLGAMAYWAHLRVRSRRWGAVIALAFYGALLEGLQGMGGVRVAELADAIANSLGAIAGFAGALVLSNLKNRIRT